VLCKLIDNAFKFSQPDGQVTIAAHSNADRMVEVCVCDIGRGIESDRLKAVFDRFYQEEGALRRTTGGTGLGLVSHLPSGGPELGRLPTPDRRDACPTARQGGKAREGYRDWKSLILEPTFESLLHTTVISFRSIKDRCHPRTWGEGIEPE